MNNVSRYGLLLLASLWAGRGAAQLAHPDSASLTDQAIIIGIGSRDTRENPGDGDVNRSDMAIIRLGVVLCTELIAADSVAARAHCFHVVQAALRSVLVHMGPCSATIRVRNGRRECWRLVNDTWSWAPMFPGDTLPPSRRP